jgi:hypothetical protein
MEQMRERHLLSTERPRTQSHERSRSYGPYGPYGGAEGAVGLDGMAADVAARPITAPGLTGVEPSDGVRPVPGMEPSTSSDERSDDISDVPSDERSELEGTEEDLDDLDDLDAAPQRARIPAGIAARRHYADEGEDDDEEEEEKEEDYYSEEEEEEFEEKFDEAEISKGSYSKESEASGSKHEGDGAAVASNGRGVVWSSASGGKGDAPAVGRSSVTIGGRPVGTPRPDAVTALVIAPPATTTAGKGVTAAAAPSNPPNPPGGAATALASVMVSAPSAPTPASGGRLLGRAAAAALQVAVETFAPGLLLEISRFDPRSVNEMILQVLQPLVSDPNLSVAGLGPLSNAAAVLCKWVRGVYKLGTGLRDLMAQYDREIGELEKELRAAQKVLEELAEDLRHEEERLELLKRKLADAKAEREAFGRRVEHDDSEQRHASALLLIVSRGPPRGPPLLTVWSARQTRLDETIEQLPCAGILICTAALVDGYMPATERYLVLCVAWDEAHQVGLPAPPSVQEVMEGEAATEATGKRVANAAAGRRDKKGGGKQAAGTKYMLGGGSKATPEDEVVEGSAPATSTKPVTKPGTKGEVAPPDTAEVRSIELFVKASAVKLQPDAERKLTSELVQSAEAASAAWEDHFSGKQ